MNCRSLGALSILILVCSFTRAANADTFLDKTTELHPSCIVVPKAHKSAAEHDTYFPLLLRLALEKTKGTDGDFCIESATDNTTSFRKLSELANKKSPINIMWASTGPELEANLLPIRFSILQGLNSYRVFLIKKNDQEKFHRVRNLSDLQQLVAGQGAQWADTQVLKMNGLPVVGAVEPEKLFSMLAAGRFDYFPRGLYEVWEEQKVHAEKGLVIEDSLLLHYSSPVYFFVNKRDVAVADRIERGLKIALADGSLDKLLRSIFGASKGLAEMKNAKRIRINLTPLINAED